MQNVVGKNESYTFTREADRAVSYLIIVENGELTRNECKFYYTHQLLAQAQWTDGKNMCFGVFTVVQGFTHHIMNE